MFRFRQICAFIATILTPGLIAAMTTAMSANAEPATIRVAALEIPLMAETRGKGLFIDLLTEIDQRSDRIDFVIRVYPGSRAMRYFREGKADLLMPFPLGTATMPGHMTIPFYVKRDFVFVRKGRAIPGNLDELAGMTVGITRQYPHHPALYANEGYRLVQASSDMANMAMLSRGRIDAFLVEEISGLHARDLAGAINVMHDPDRPVFEAPTVLVLSPGKDGLWQSQHISDILRAMQQDGSYDRILHPGS